MNKYKESQQEYSQLRHEAEVLHEAAQILGKRFNYRLESEVKSAANRRSTA